MLQKATCVAFSNIAFIKWTIRQHVADYIDRAAGDWNWETRNRDVYRRCYNDLRNQKARAQFKRGLLI